MWFGASPESGAREFDPVEIQDPFHRQATVRQRWSRDAVRWRAAYIAREVFGPEARVAPSVISPRGALGGILDVEVPISEWEEYRRREAVFLAWVGADPLLAEADYLYLMGPRLMDLRRP